MSTLPGRARAVVIGAGIVGNSMAYHLWRQGWSDLVLIDKGPFPNPGGSTGHASNFIFPVDHSKEMTALTLDSVRQYKELGVFTESGGIEVARTEERMQELQRRMSSAAAWGVERLSIVTPAEIKELVPFIDESVIVGGFYTPGVGVVDSLRAGTIMRERAQEAGALTVSPNTEVLGIDVEHGRVRARADDPRRHRGRVRRHRLRRAGARSIARMAGASIPLTPAVHQMIDVGPVPRFADAKSHIEYPIVRDMDTNMYERQDGSGPRDRLVRPPRDPARPRGDPVGRGGVALADRVAVHAGRLRPADGARARADARDRRRRDGRREVRDQRPALADARRHAAARRDARGEGPLVGAPRCGSRRARASASRVAEWMVHGESEIDLHSSDIARFWEHQKTRAHVRARAAEGFNKTYGIVHPGEQWASNRDVRLSPFHARERELGAVFFEAAGWERPHWYESNAPLVEEYGDRVMPARGRVGLALVVADHQRRAPGDARPGRHGRPDARSRSSTSPGPGALAARAGGVRCGRWTSPSGGSSTRRSSRRAAGSRPTSRSCGSATTTSGSSPAAPTAWPTRSGSPTTCRPTARAQLVRPHVGLDDARPVGAAGARHPGSRSPATTSRTRASGSAPAARSRSDTLRVLASRISYVGDLGWELYVPMEQGARLWDILWEAGRAHGARPGRHRRLRHHRPAREVLPRLRVRARDRVQRRRGGHGGAEGEGRGLRRPRRAPAPPRRGPGRDPVHADRRRPHVAERRQALHARARADPDAATGSRSSTARAGGRT